jgi:allophanate hydrolase
MTSLPDRVASVYDRLAQEPLNPVWISLVPEEEALSRARTLERSEEAKRLPLYGMTFAVKDNIDVEAMHTTAACPAFAYEAEHSATVVKRLISAGAILIGKTNMDQFATGLVGVRSPYGACSSVFHPEYISGGSSSGSAVAVAKGLVDFSLGTDTAGSGRVPAACNNLIGLKPTRGLLSTAGIVPACRTLDCVSVFARTSAEAKAVWLAAQGIDTADPGSRAIPPGGDAAPWVAGGKFRFGVPLPDQQEFFGDTSARDLFQAAIDRLQELGGDRVFIDFTPFRDAASLLYSGPWVAERLAAIEPFLEKHADTMHPVVRNIISGGRKYSAVEAFRSAYRLQELRRTAEAEWLHIDVMLLPTTGTTYTIEEVENDPVQLNTNLGYYTNFVNLLDLAAVALPAGFRANGLPFGVSLIGRAFSDAALLALAARFEGEEAQCPAQSPGCIEVAVLGAHLSGQPLNKELTSRRARLVRTAKTAPGYRFYALQNTTPQKPGLVRDPHFEGPGIEVEIWSVPSNEFGSFVAGVPAPLGIGNALLEDGSEVKCFICEPYAVPGSEDITCFGGWRKHLAR